MSPQKYFVFSNAEGGGLDFKCMSVTKQLETLRNFNSYLTDLLAVFNLYIEK
jgi:hypothetical protein